IKSQSKTNEAFMARRGFVSSVHHRKPAGRPVPKHMRCPNTCDAQTHAMPKHMRCPSPYDAQVHAPPKPMRRGNNTKSKHRAPVEHVFAVQKHMMGLAVRTIAIAHAKLPVRRSGTG
ncbi:MAG: hypothetical protein AAF501_06425, partial [Pseudomonadota bacterium]